MKLEGRHVVITGAASGIGRALARRVAEENPARVVAADLDVDGAQAVADQIGGLGTAVDVGREADIVALIDAAEASNGPIDLFCSNAGVTGPAGGPETPDEAWDMTWRINVMSQVWAARALLPRMIERGEGYLLNTASAAGLLTAPAILPYAVTKHASVALAEWISFNYGDAGIKVSCLCPAAVRTPMIDDALKDPVGGPLLEAGGVLEPEQVAEIVVAGIDEERFLILAHGEIAQHLAIKAADPERWITEMRHLVRNPQSAGSPKPKP